MFQDFLACFTCLQDPVYASSIVQKPIEFGRINDKKCYYLPALAVMFEWMKHLSTFLQMSVYSTRQGFPEFMEL